MGSRPAILDQIVRPQQGGFSEELARYVLSLRFTSEQQTRYAELAEKAQQGALNDSEAAEIDEYLSVEALLTILQSKARVSLRQYGSAASGGNGQGD